MVHGNSVKLVLAAAVSKLYLGFLELRSRTQPCKKREREREKKRTTHPRSWTQDSDLECTCRKRWQGCIGGSSHRRQYNARRGHPVYAIMANQQPRPWARAWPPCYVATNSSRHHGTRTLLCLLFCSELVEDRSVAPLRPPRLIEGCTR